MNKITVLLIGLLVALLLPSVSHGCSMYKITKNGKTIVGNNEDYLTPNNQFWFEQGNKDTLGVMYMGLLNNFAQGAINEKGLVFDGFFEPYLAINNTEGKKDIPIADAVRSIMQSMTTVEEVKAYLSTINLSALTNSQLVFVDRSGTYLIVEGDNLLIGEEPEKSFSNFYYSQVNSLDEVELDYFQRGRKFISTTENKASLDYCGMVMKNFAQTAKEAAATQYSTIYDLDQLTVRVYLFHDYSEFVDINLKDALRKGDHRTMIADLFPKASLGYQHYAKYNSTEDPALCLKEIIGDLVIPEEELTTQGFDWIVNEVGYEWLNQKNDYKSACKVFEYGLSLMPNNANLFDSLGEAFFVGKEWDNALKNYAKSLYLNVDNANAIKMIAKIEKERQKANKKE